MKTAEKLLNIFIAHADQWLSGESLADELNLTRAAIWKSINKLTDSGFDIESQRGLGYRYTPNEKMNANAIQQLLDFPVSVQVFESLESTNKYAKLALINEEITEPTVIISNIQTHGIGHLGRPFFSPSQTGLYMSIALPLDNNTVVQPNLLTLGTAVAVSNSIYKLFNTQIQFKWMNNLFLNQHKIGGILTEAITTFESHTYSALIIGIGINLAPSQTKKIQKIGFVTDQLTIARNNIAAQVIDDFFKMYANYQDGVFLTNYRANLIGYNQPATIKTANKQLFGTLLDVTNDGYLRLDNAGQVTTVKCGDML